MDPYDEDQEEGVGWWATAERVSLLEDAKRTAAGKLQVIEKIVDYELGVANPVHPIGAWHVEGMSHENIACSAVCVLRKDMGIQGGELFFKRAFDVDEWKDFTEGAEDAAQMT